MAKVLKQFYIRKDQVKRLELESNNHLSQAEIVRQALDNYFKQKKEGK